MSWLEVSRWFQTVHELLRHWWCGAAALALLVWLSKHLFGLVIDEYFRRIVLRTGAELKALAQAVEILRREADLSKMLCDKLIAENERLLKIVANQEFELSRIRPAGL